MMTATAPARKPVGRPARHPLTPGLLATVATLLVSAAAPTATAAVAYATWVTTDTSSEFRGGWSARVGYFGPEGRDPAANVTLAGQLVGSTFELHLPDPFSGMSAEVYDGLLTESDALTLTGTWYGDVSGLFETTRDGTEYALQAIYTLGGFNDRGGDLVSPPEDFMWGWWEGTFSIRRPDSVIAVPECGTPISLLTLGLTLTLARRRLSYRLP